MGQRVATSPLQAQLTQGLSEMGLVEKMASLRMFKLFKRETDDQRQPLGILGFLIFGSSRP